MKYNFWIMRMLLAGVPALAMTAGADGAGAVTFDLTGSLVDYTVPADGVYDIAAYGAQGGTSFFFNGGLGAEAGGDIRLSAGTILSLTVGGAGEQTLFNGGGGGGSFVFNITDGAYLVVAGGGGGSGFAGDGGPGLRTTAGGAGGSAGGSGGSHGMGGAGSLGGGGAGVLSGGSAGSGGDGAPSITSFGPFPVPGGFGGGGGGADNTSGGGGGGFSGGGGGGVGEFGGVFGSGGGGGSFLSPTLAHPVLLSGVNSGDGFVTIDLVRPAIPETSTWTMMAAGFAALALLSLRRKPKPFAV